MKGIFFAVWLLFTAPVLFAQNRGQGETMTLPDELYTPFEMPEFEIPWTFYDEIQYTKYDYNENGLTNWKFYYDSSSGENIYHIYSYDGENRLTNDLQLGYYAAEMTSYEYNDQNQMTKWSRYSLFFPDDVYVLTYNDDGQILTERSVSWGSVDTYRYDDFGNQIHYDINGFYSNECLYDDQNRLIWEFEDYGTDYEFSNSICYFEGTQTNLNILSGNYYGEIYTVTNRHSWEDGLLVKLEYLDPDYDDSVTVYGYDENGRRISAEYVSESGVMTSDSWTYNQDGTTNSHVSYHNGDYPRAEDWFPPVTTTTLYEYDEAGRLIAERETDTDGNDHLILLEYDEAGRLTLETYEWDWVEYDW